VTETRDSKTTVTDWTHDAIGRLTKEAYDSSNNAKDYVANYKFDLASNRVSKVQTGAGAESTTSLYNVRNELTSTTTNGVTTSYGYDLNGSTLTQGSKSFTWDLRGRMASFTAEGVTTVYTYDHNSVRVSKKVGTGPTRTFVNDASNPTGYSKPIEEKVNGSVDTSYVLGLTVLGQQNASNGYLSLMQDGRGKTRGVMNLSGVDVQPADYDAYGNALAAGLTVTPWQNPDGYTDFESGLTQQLARSFDRETGTAVSRDPTIFGVGEYHDANLHLYVGGSPLLLGDPSGYEGVVSQLSQLGIRGAMYGIVTGAIVGAGIGAAIGGATGAYLHIVTHESFDGIGTSIWDGAKSGAVWGAVIGASSINPQLLAITVTASLGYSAGQAILAVADSGLPVRTKVAICALLLLQGTVAKAALQRGATAASDPNYNANVAARTAYLNQRASLQKMISELQKGKTNSEGIARAVVEYRNNMKIQARGLMRPEDVAKLEARNQQLYGNKIGPTPEWFYSKNNSSWDAVIKSSVRTNAHIDSMYGPNQFNIPFPPLEDIDR
jgi:RHS repeat-associated protein